MKFYHTVLDLKLTCCCFREFSSNEMAEELARADELRKKEAERLRNEMEDEKKSYLDIGTPLPGSRADIVWRYAHGNYAYKTKQTMPNRP